MLSLRITHSVPTSDLHGELSNVNVGSKKLIDTEVQLGETTKWSQAQFVYSFILSNM